MKERPIIMTAESVRAILDGHKTMTRRVVKPGRTFPMQSDWELEVLPNGGIIRQSKDDIVFSVKSGGLSKAMQDKIIRCPYGVPGDRLWVKETYALDIPGCPNGVTYHADHVDPKGDGPANPIKWKSPLFMPRKYSRITLEILSVRVERVQEMTYHDLEAEGMSGELGAAIEQYIKLWDSLNAKRGYPWADNPWVFVIKFEAAQGETSMRNPG